MAGNHSSGTGGVLGSSELNRDTAGLQGTYGWAVQSGAVTFSTGLTFNVAAIAAADYKVAGVNGASYAGGTVVLTAQDATNPRVDIIVITVAGAVSAVAGTPAALTTTGGPGPATPTAAQLEIARIYVPASGGTLSATNITDRRVALPDGAVTLTTTGDIIYASAAHTPARLGVGSTNQALGVTGGIPAWQASSKSVLTTTGDVMYASAANVPARLGIGSTGQTLTVSGGLPVWAGQVTSIGAILDGGGSAIAANTIIYVRVPFACTINEFTILADQSGSITVKVYKDTYANYPPIAADDISNGGLAVTTTTKATDTTLTSWTTAIAAGDVLAFTNTTVATTITRATCQLKVTRA